MSKTPSKIIDYTDNRGVLRKKSNKKNYKRKPITKYTFKYTSFQVNK